MESSPCSALAIRNKSVGAVRAKRHWTAPTIVWDRAAATPNASSAPVMVASGSSGSGGGVAGTDSVGSAGHAPVQDVAGRSSGAFLGVVKCEAA